MSLGGCSVDIRVHVRTRLWRGIPINSLLEVFLGVSNHRTWKVVHGDLPNRPIESAPGGGVFIKLQQYSRPELAQQVSPREDLPLPP